MRTMEVITSSRSLKRKLSNAGEETKKRPNTLMDFVAAEPGSAAFMRAVEVPPKVSTFPSTDNAKIALALAGSALHSTGASFTVIPADTHFVIHCRNVSGWMPLQTFEESLKELGAHWQVSHAMFNLRKQCVDIPIKHYGSIHTTNVSNVVTTGALVSLPDTAVKRRPSDITDEFDWQLIGNCIHHIENMQGADTPADLKVYVTTPSGVCFNNFDKTIESKTETKRTNYLVRVTGFREITRAQCQSFLDLAKWHYHHLSIDWVTGSLEWQVQPYLKPLTGVVSPVVADTVAASRAM